MSMQIRARRHTLAIATLLAVIAAPASAERADRDKPISLEANRISVDDVKKVQIYDGNVVLTQGTLVIRSDRIVVSQDADGFQKGVATGGPGGLARFKQKREGQNEYIEGEAERIEHDARSETTQFFVRAWVRSGLDEVKGNYISYDSVNERYQVSSGVSADGKGPAKTEGGRVRAIIQPKGKSDGEAAKGDPLTLKPSANLPNKE
ncbi:MAG: lipopolysaccharide transport periplasmic protein LptA [Rhodocyclaceae bacterium]|nr:lipopolysaccharide transport periplasmic protein LptA [Rhodocyclaceae bacterium]